MTTQQRLDGIRERYNNVFVKDDCTELEVLTYIGLSTMDIAFLLSLIKEYRRALEWYADGLRPSGSDVSEYKPQEMREGRRARAALALKPSEPEEGV